MSAPNLSRSNRFLVSMFTGAGSVLLKAGLNLVLIPVIFSQMGVDSYSLFVLLATFVELSMFLNLGFSSALIKVLGSTSTATTPTTSNLSTPRKAVLLAVGNRLYIVLALVMLVIGISSLYWFPQAFHVPNSLLSITGLCLLLATFDASLRVYTCYLESVLYAHTLHAWNHVGDTIGYGLGNALGLAALLTGWGLPGLVAARLLASVLRSFLLLYQAWRVENGQLYPKAPFSWPVFRELFSLSSHSFVIDLSVMVSHKIDHFVIATFLPFQMVGWFEVVFRFLGVINQVCGKVCDGLLPTFSRLLSSGQTAESRKLFLQMSGFLNLLAGVLLCWVVTFYPQLFELFTAHRIPLEKTLPILWLATPIIWSGALQLPAVHYLFTSGRHQYLSGSSVIAAAANLVLSLVLVHPLGLVGVTLGTFIPQIIQQQASLIATTCKSLGISFPQYLQSVHLRVWGILAFTAVVMHSAASWLLPILPEDNKALMLGTLSSVVIVAIPLAAIAWFWLTFQAADRKAVVEKVTAMAARVFNKKGAKQGEQPA